MHHYLKIFTLLSTSIILFACAVNPVTGKNELALIGQQDEISIGQQNYAPSIQTQGGVFTLDPALTRYVKSVGQRLALKSDRNLPYEFEIIDNSEPNAWALPGGKLAINRGMLLQMNSEAELATVLGHEIVHAAAGHSRQQMQSSQLLNIGMQVLNQSLAGTGYGGLAMQGASLGAQVLSSKYSQSQELEADAYGMKYMALAGFNTEGAVKIQETFYRLSQERGGNSSALASLFSSHPPSAQRVAANRSRLSEYPPRGDMGTSSYQQATANLRRWKPAFDLYDQGVKATGQKQYSSALNYANQAISRLSDEGAFYELRGFNQEKLGQTQNALSSYQQAIQKTPNYFSPYYRRGLLYKSLGQRSAAEQDLIKSYQLLPDENIKKAILELRGQTTQ